MRLFRGGPEITPDNRVKILMRISPLPLHHVAMARIPWTARMGHEWEDDSRPLPAKVYPVADEPEWVVEPPASASPASAGTRTFSGPVALSQALEYAYRTYGSARFLSR
jgi:hypothetical protein